MSAGVDVVCSGIADDLTDAVGGAIGSLAGELGTAVTIEIIHHELGVVGAGADIFTEVDLPEEGAVEAVGLQDGRIAATGL